MKWGYRGQKETASHPQTHESKALLPWSQVRLSVCTERGFPELWRGYQHGGALGDVWLHLPWNVSSGAPRKGRPGSPGPAPPTESKHGTIPFDSQEPGHHTAVRLSASLGIFRVSSFLCPNLKCLDTFFLMVVPIPHVSNTHLK